MPQLRMRRVTTLALAALASLCGFVAAARAEEPAFSPQTRDRLTLALKNYEELLGRGGWKPLSRSVSGLAQGASGSAVLALHERLLSSGDISADHAKGDVFGDATLEALKKFQARHGLSLTGTVGTLTFRALNVPVEKRVQQLRASLERLKEYKFNFPARHVVLNIPAASVEAVDNGQVAHRYIAVVGRPDRASPTLQARISAVNLNPYWTAPTSIVKADIIPKVQKDPQFLAKHNMRLIGGNHQEIDPATIDWAKTSGNQFYVRQDPGAENALGAVRIDMPNTHAVYMHDTPKKSLFRSDVRFHSSGCARVSGVRDLAAWLLEGSGIDRLALETEIATGENKTIRLQKSVPVIWIYMTAWGNADGSVDFRDDIYKLDEPKPATPPVQDPMIARAGDARDVTGTIKPRAKPAAAQAAAPSKKIAAPKLPVIAKARPMTAAVEASALPVMPQALAQPLASTGFGPR